MSNDRMAKIAIDRKGNEICAFGFSFQNQCTIARVPG